MLNMIKSWLLDVELKKGVQVAAQAVAAYLLAHANVLKSLGVTAAIDPNQLQVALLGGIHYLLNIPARYQAMEAHRCSTSSRHQG